MNYELVFKLKKMFDHNDIVAKWIIKLAMIRNDFYYIHKSLFHFFDEEKEIHSGLLTYYFRLSASHYREASKFVESFSKNKLIKEFVYSLSKETIENYEAILKSCTPWEESFVYQIVKPIRDNFYHYTDKSFETDFEQLDDFFTRIINTGQTKKDTDLVFADEISMNIIFGDKSKEEISEIVKELSNYMLCLTNFVDEAIGSYLLFRKQRSSYSIRKNK